MQDEELEEIIYFKEITVKINSKNMFRHFLSWHIINFGCSVVQ